MTPLSRYVVETLVTLLAVVVLCVVLLSALRRVGVGKVGGPLELLARLPLEGRRAVYLVRAGETVYVLAASDNALSKLGEMPREALPLSEPLEPQTFSAVLKRAIGVKSTDAPAATEPAPSNKDVPPREPS
jgi:flagellar biogenesis protein FliO